VSECLTTLSPTVFTQRNFVADFLQAKCNFTRKTAILRFSPPSGHRDNVWCSSLLIGKHAMDFLLVLIDLFLLDVMAEALRAKIDRKSLFCKGVGQYLPNFHIEGYVLYQSFLHGYRGQWMPYNFVADSFHTKKLCSRLSSSKVRFQLENGHFAFWAPFGGFRGNVQCSP